MMVYQMVEKMLYIGKKENAKEQGVMYAHDAKTLIYRY